MRAGLLRPGHGVTTDGLGAARDSDEVNAAAIRQFSRRDRARSESGCRAGSRASLARLPGKGESIHCRFRRLVGSCSGRN